MLARTGQAVLAGSLGVPFFVRAANKAAERWPHGAVVGENTGMRVGEKILAEGGNAIDAAVGAMLAASVAAPARCGIGGYGGFATIALTGGKKTTTIDFNTAAPAAATAGMFPLDDKGAVKDRVNFYGWKAVGVPGVLAGLQQALDRYGTRPFREVVQPAIRIARDGVPINKIFAGTIHAAEQQFAKDPASVKLYFKDGRVLQEGDVLRNPDLAQMLSVLAQRNSVESFYRGDLAQRIGEACQRNGGLLTAKDLSAYRAREVHPLQLSYNGFDVFTAPLTAGGVTTLEALSILKALDWQPSGESGPAAHARLEALRLAWKDRLELFGDPAFVKIPVKKLLARDYALELAAKVRGAVKEKKPLAVNVAPHHDAGTTNISSVDRHGNLCAITATHGNGFGAQVTLEGLGLTLGHGMSRFDPNPQHPNAPGPGKRPVMNVCPTVVLKSGKPILAIGGGGGEKIPNGIFDALTQYVVQHATMESAIAAPRVHNMGTLYVAVEPHCPAAASQYLKDVGFNVQTWESSAVFNGVSFDPANGECRGTIRGPAALELRL